MADDDNEGLAGMAAAAALAGLFGVGMAVRNVRGHRRGEANAQRLAEEGVRFRVQGDLNQASRCWLEAIKHDAENSLARSGHAWVLAVHGTAPQHLTAAVQSIDLAVKNLKPAAGPQERADCLNTRAEIYFRRGEFHASIQDSRACLALCQPAAQQQAVARWLAVQASRRIGVAHGHLGEMAPGYAALRTAIAYEPDNLDNRICLARLAAGASDHETAIAEYRAAAQIVAGQRERFRNGDFLLSTLLNDLGCALNAVNRQAEADQVFQAAVSASNANPYPMLNTAFSAGRRGDRDEMRRLVNAALTVADPADAHLTYSLLTEAASDANGDLLLDALLTYRRIPHQIYLRQRELLSKRTSAPGSGNSISGHDPGLGAVAGKIRILLLCANPLDTGRISVEQEMRRITEKVRLSSERERMEFIPCPDARPDDLIHYLDLHRPHIVHFSGHGSAAGEIVLAGESTSSTRVGAQALGRIFQSMKGNVQVVVLNACWSAIQAEAIAEHIDWVVGMRSQIDDEAAAYFAAAFYRALGLRLTIAEAFDRGQLALVAENFADRDVPQLMSRPGAHERIRFSQ